MKKWVVMLKNLTAPFSYPPAGERTCGRYARRLWPFLLLALLAWSRPAGAAVSLFDDFSDRTLNNYSFSRTTGTGAAGTISLNYASLTTTAKPRGNQNYSLEISYDVSMTNGFVYFIDYLSGTSRDLSVYKYFSFWVRGAVGGEGFQVGLGNDSPWFETKVQVNDWLPNGITTQWQKVVIPLNVLDNIDAAFNPATIKKLVLVMDHNTQFGAQGGKIYLDDITFGTAAPGVWIDNHNKGNNPNACQSNNFAWNSSGSGLAASYVAVTYSPQAPYVWKCDYATATGAGGFTHGLPTAAGGVDLSQCSDLEFDVLGGPGGGQTPGVKIRSNGIDYERNLAFYVSPSDTEYRHVSIPLADFPGVLNLVSEVTFNVILPPQSSFYVDNMVVSNRNAPQVPSTPTAMTHKGNAVFPWYAVYDNGSVSVTAASLLADPKLEGVAFEYSADSGTTWTTIGNDYAVADAKTNYGAFWDISGLAFGPYLLRATAFHADGTVASLQYAINLTNGTPTFTPTVTVTPTWTPTSSATPTNTPTSTPTATPTSTPTATPTGTFTATTTATPTVTPTATATVTPTSSPTATQTATPTATATSTLTVTRTSTATPTPTATPTATATGTPTATPTATQSATATASASPTPTPSATLTATESATATATDTRTPTGTRTATFTVTPTATPTTTRTATRTATLTPTASASSTVSATDTITLTVSPTPTASPSPTVTPDYSPTAVSTPTATRSATATPPAAVLPSEFQAQVLRNSFNPARGESVPMTVSLTQRGTLTVVIFTRSGTKVRELINQESGPGVLPLTWDGKNANGEVVASGVYVIYVHAAEGQAKRLVAVIK
jgi:hypothetical protein